MGKTALILGVQRAGSLLHKNWDIVPGYICKAEENSLHEIYLY